MNTAGAPFPGTSGKTSFTDVTVPQAFSWDGLTGIEKPVTNILKMGEKPNTINGMTLGVFVLEDVADGNYILEIKREGFLTRRTKIRVNADQPVQFLEHREIIPGDINDDLLINLADLSQLKMMVGGNFLDPTTNYDPKYDLNADGRIDLLDFNLILKLSGFWFYHYEDTMDWLKELKIEKLNPLLK